MLTDIQKSEICKNYEREIEDILKSELIFENWQSEFHEYIFDDPYDCPYVAATFECEKPVNIIDSIKLNVLCIGHEDYKWSFKIKTKFKIFEKSIRFYFGEDVMRYLSQKFIPELKNVLFQILIFDSYANNNVKNIIDVCRSYS